MESGSIGKKYVSSLIVFETYFLATDFYQILSCVTICPKNHVRVLRDLLWFNVFGNLLTILPASFAVTVLTPQQSDDSYSSHIAILYEEQEIWPQ